MATRRSRLQIKPNILGGPKGPSTKPAPKASAKIASNEEVDAAKTDTGNKVKSPTRITSPRRSITISPLKEAGAEKIVKDEKSVENKAASKKDAKDVPEKELEKMEKEDSKKSDSPSLQARARLRRFGKVNISAARGVKHDSQGSNNEEKSDKEDSLPKLKNESPKATDVEKKDGSNKEKEDLDKEVKESSDKNSSQSSENTSIQRRSRFPKAKPNIADASRRKQKESVPKEDTANSSVVDNSSSSIPEIKVTDVSANENDSKASSTKNEMAPHLDSPHALTKLQPRPSATPIPIPKSPLKHPTPTIPVSPDKRTRTLSISEPPVVKRQRKPKVDAPTDKPPDRTTMKIRDLIRWNPSSNPMKPKIRNTDSIVSGIEKENIVKKVSGGTGDKVEASAQEAADSALPVPQVTIGPDGNIVINEKSLIVKEQDKVSSQEEEVIDETDVFTTYGSFRKRNMSKRWSKKDTKKFYKALAMIGIDFFLISQLFPDRTRLEIKKKFKKEEKVNRTLVEKVLKERIQFDPTVFDNQEKEEESSEDEDDEEPKKKKGGKRGPKKRERKDSELNQQTPSVRRAVKRNKRSKNYFEDDSTDDEEVVEKKSLRVDGPWQPPSVSQKDGEVVGILMDMSEGRITGEGQGQEGVMNGMDDNSKDSYGSDKLIAVPINKAHKGRGFIPLEPKNVNPNSEVELNASSNACRTVRNIPAIPGIQSINIMETDQAARTGSSAVSLPAQIQSVTRQQTALNSSSNQIVLPFLHKTSSTVSETETRQNVNLYSQQVQFNQNSLLNNEMHERTSLNELDIGTSHSQLQVATNQNSEQVGNNDTEEMDQYVLVTVVPEDGGETIIHIYRMHGGTQSQNQIMYADPYASQQLMFDSTAISNSVAQSQNLTNNSCIPPNDTELPLTLSETPLDYTLTSKSRSDIGENAGGSLFESTSQETVGNCSTSVTNANPNLDISDNMVPATKDDIQLSYEPVSTDITSQQLISNKETTVEDSERNLTLTSGNTKPEVYLSNATPDDTSSRFKDDTSSRFKDELEYEVENS